jgi:hypothetical protein
MYPKIGESKLKDKRHRIRSRNWWRLLVGTLLLGVSHRSWKTIPRAGVVASSADERYAGTESSVDAGAIATMIIRSSSKQNASMDLILERMAAAGPALAESHRRQMAFRTRRSIIGVAFPKPYRFQSYLNTWAANIVNDEYAYIHIFKVNCDGCQFGRRWTCLQCNRLSNLSNLIFHLSNCLSFLE